MTRERIGISLLSGGPDGLRPNRDYRFIVRFRTFLHRNLIGLVRQYYNRLWGTHIGAGSRISLSAKLDRTNPRGITIGEFTALAFDSSVLTHDFVNGRHLDVSIGSYCFIGARAIIMPGVTIGDHCIIGSGSVVMRDVPAHALAMGNPARVIERGIDTTHFGRRTARHEASSDEPGTAPPAHPGAEGQRT